MKYERLTTNNVQSNKDFLLNFAFVKDGEVYLRGMGDDTEEIRLCDYIAIRATSEKGCERTPQDILDGACNECQCELAALNIAAIQAAELRHRLSELEDKIESGEIVELPCLRDKPTLYYHDEPILRKELNYMTKDGSICSECFHEDEFEEAERRLKELKGEENND